MKNAVLEALSERAAEWDSDDGTLRRETLLADVLFDMRAAGLLSKKAVEEEAINFVPSGVHTSGLRIIISWLI